MLLSHVRSVRRNGGGSRRERGTALVELAFIGILLSTMVAGTWNYGTAWRAGMRVAEGARTGVRTGSAMGKTQYADWYALSGLKASLESSGNINNVTRVVIYRADAADGAVPADCKTTVQTTSSKCNIILGPKLLTIAQNLFDANGCYTQALVSMWCPMARVDVQATAEYYGIWVQLVQPYDFKMLGTNMTIERNAVMRLEP